MRQKLHKQTPNGVPISTIGLGTISSKKSNINYKITQCLNSVGQCQGIDNCTCIGQNATSSLPKYESKIVFRFLFFWCFLKTSFSYFILFLFIFLRIVLKINHIDM